MFNATNSEPTEALLKAISDRLAGRSELSKVNYQVTIDHTGVHMHPLVYVFPNRYKRKEVDKLDIVTYVHMYKLPNLQLDQLVFGTYVYQSNYDRTRRRWIRI